MTRPDMEAFEGLTSYMDTSVNENPVFTKVGEV